MTVMATDVSSWVDGAIATIWDELSDSAASDPAQAIAALMVALSRLSGAHNATWAGAVRVGPSRTDDALQGWRVAAMQTLVPRAPAGTAPDSGAETGFRTILRKWEQREIDESFTLPLRDVGRFRTYTFRRDLRPEWFASDFYRVHYESMGVHDAAFVAFPLNADCESHFGFYGRSTFDEASIMALATALRAVKWFHRRLLLSQGLLVASAALTPTERDVLGHLLAGRSEKEIALRRGVAASTIHQHVLGIYRKFGVGSRATLMALWLTAA